MNLLEAAQNGLASLIEQLQKQKEELAEMYNRALLNGEKYYEVRTMYITLIDVDKKLSDLKRVCN